MELLLPYPPSVNHYWIRSSRGMFIGKRGKEYREDVKDIADICKARKLEKPLKVEVWQLLPDRRQRDIDNIFKALFDALTHADIWNDDSQIYELVAHKIDYNAHKRKGGCVRVIIKEL